VKDEAKAAGYFKFAADQNHAATQFHYALCLKDGGCIVKDEAEAAGHFKFTVDQNYTSAEFHYVF
jgi:TPR repeat protein